MTELSRVQRSAVQRSAEEAHGQEEWSGRQSLRGEMKRTLGRSYQILATYSVHGALQSVSGGQKIREHRTELRSPERNISSCPDL